jgi:glucokinase
VTSYLAVDIGGTKMAAGIVADDGTIVASSKTPTPKTTDPAAVWGALCSIIDQLDTTDIIAVGVGCGGPMSAGGATVSPLNIPAWRDFPLQQQLHDYCNAPTFVDNDAKALALGEGWVGAARGEANYIAMVVSTGVGGGIVLDGRLLDGTSGNAGHIGHIVVEPGGRLCACGARGCVEAEASGTAIAAITSAQPKDAPPEIIERTGVMVGRAIAATANLLDLQLAVVAGSVALGYGEPFFAAAQRTITELCKLEFARTTTVRAAGLGKDGPLIGAAQIARRRM